MRFIALRSHSLKDENGEPDRLKKVPADFCFIRLKDNDFLSILIVIYSEILINV